MNFIYYQSIFYKKLYFSGNLNLKNTRNKILPNLIKISLSDDDQKTVNLAFTYNSKSLPIHQKKNQSTV